MVQHIVSTWYAGHMNIFWGNDARALVMYLSFDLEFLLSENYFLNQGLFC